MANFSIFLFSNLSFPVFKLLSIRFEERLQAEYVRSGKGRSGNVYFSKRKAKITRRKMHRYVSCIYLLCVNLHNASLVHAIICCITHNELVIIPRGKTFYAMCNLYKWQVPFSRITRYQLILDSWRVSLTSASVLRIFLRNFVFESYGRYLERTVITNSACLFLGVLLDTDLRSIFPQQCRKGCQLSWRQICFKQGRSV